MGDVSLCPSGDLGEGKSVRKDDVIAATRALLESANVDQPDTDRMWMLLDPSLQDAFGTEESFTKRILKASFDDAFREWSISDEVFLDSGPVLGQLISDTCGEEVSHATVMGQAFFPAFDGLSGGSAQFYFVVRDEALRFWLLD